MRLAAAACLVLLAAAQPAEAQDDPFAPGEDDWQALSACLADRANAGESGTGCVGAISGPCIEDPENQSTAAMNGCLSKEADMWDHYLNQWYGILTGRLEGGQLAALKDAQRAWIRMRDATCEFEASLWEGGTGASTAANECFMRETGHRAVFLSSMVDFVMQ